MYSIFYFIFVSAFLLSFQLESSHFLTPYKPFIKSLPMVLLAIVSAHKVIGKDGIFLCLAFLFAGCGDFVLEWDAKNYFILGMIFFAITHILYSLIFYGRFQKSKTALILSGCLLVYAAVLLFVLQPYLGALSIPVYCYIAIIITMGIFAIFNNSKILLLGIVLFIASDSLLAINKFIGSFNYARYAISLTYFLGQYFVLKSFLTLTPNKNRI